MKLIIKQTFKTRPALAIPSKLLTTHCSASKENNDNL